MMQEAVATALASGNMGDDGVEDAFELLHELPDKVSSSYASRPPTILCLLESVAILCSWWLLGVM